MSVKTLATILSLVLGACLIPGAVLALEYPTREIQYIVPWGPGSTNDQFSRLATTFAEKYVGKPLVVINKAGGGGVVGWSALAAAKPDGYTIGLVGQSVISQPYLVKGVTYHYKKSFRLISQMTYSGYALFTNKGGPFDIPLKEIVRRAKEKPNTIRVGTSGQWGAPEFARAIFEEEAGIKLIRVPFPGATDLMPTLLGGHLDFAIGSAGEWAPLYKAGSFNLVAMCAEQRDPRFPNVPTFRESGYDVVMSTIHWVGAPTGTPDPIINFLADAFRKAAAEKAFKDGAENLGGTAAWEGPEGAMKSMERVEQLYLRVIKKYDLKPQ